MKCTNEKKLRGLACLCVLTLLAGIMSGCGSLSYDMPYSVDAAVSGFNVVSRQETRTAASFAADICVVTGNYDPETGLDFSNVGSAMLVNVSDRAVVYALNPHTRLHPASLTKVMTALVALENGNLSNVLTATNAVNINESGAVLCGLQQGDTMTLDQALRILLVYSANDAANLIAENIGGSVEHFVEMMNEKARELGATNTNFVNPHGLTDVNHYTTAYDMYLIFNEAVKNETFSEIIHMTGYQTTYYDKNGREKKFDRSTTNLYLKGEQRAPGNVTVIGGKTGTTNAAGHCLVLLTRDEGGSPYISVILRDSSRDELYTDMTDLLKEIHK